MRSCLYCGGVLFFYFQEGWRCLTHQNCTGEVFCAPRCLTRQQWTAPAPSSLPLKKRESPFLPPPPKGLPQRSTKRAFPLSPGATWKRATAPGSLGVWLWAAGPCLAILKSYGNKQINYKWEGRGEQKTVSRKKKKFTASAINRLNSKAKRKYPQSNRGSKSISKKGAKDGQGQGDSQRGDNTGPRPQSQALPPTRLCPLCAGRTVPKNATANIFFNNIFYFLFPDWLDKGI